MVSFESSPTTVEPLSLAAEFDRESRKASAASTTATTERLRLAAVEMRFMAFFLL